MTLIKKSVAMLLLLCMLSVMLASCKKDGENGSELTFSDVYSSDFIATENYDVSFETIKLGGSDIQKVSGRVVQYYNDSRYCFYDIDRNNVFLTVNRDLTKTQQFSILLSEYACVKEWSRNSDYEAVKIYNLSGEEVLSLDPEADIYGSGNVIYENNNAYVMKDGANVAKFTVPNYFDTEEFTYTEKFAYAVREGYIAFYDESFAPMARIDLPPGAENVTCRVIAKDRVIVFYTRELSDGSEEYSYIEDSVKYELYQAVYDPVEETTEPLGDDIYVLYVLCDTANGGLCDYGFSDEIDNVVIYSPIVDGKVVTDEKYMRCALMDADGKLGAHIDEFFDDQVGMAVSMRGSGYFITELKAGCAAVTPDGDISETFLIDEAIFPKSFGYVMLTEEGVTVYDKNFENAEEYPGATIAENGYDGVIINTDYGAYYYCTADKQVQVRYIGFGVYIASDQVMYSLSGNKLESNVSEYEVVAKTRSAMLIVYKDEAGYKYARITWGEGEEINE